MATGADRRPKTWFGLGGAVVATVALVVVLRILAGELFGRPARLVTYVGIIGGAVAAVVMMGALEQWATIRESDAGLFRLIQWSHITYLTIAGGLYPTVMARGVRLSTEWYAALPGALLTAVVWSELLFVLAAVIYLVVDALPASRSALDIWLNLFWLFLLYGVLFGLIVGATRSVWLPLLG